MWVLFGFMSCAVMGEDKTGKTFNFPEFNESFAVDSIENGTWQTFDRGEFTIQEGVLRVTDGWVSTGDEQWNNYSMTFRARAPETARQVQIWAGFRQYNRDYRYVVALRGGPNNQLYLARYGAEGYDKMLDEIPLDFTPAPGVWYDLNVVVAGNQIAVYLNKEESPRILVTDENSPFSAGGISLGGSYMATEFDGVVVKPVAADALEGVKKQEPVKCSAEQKAVTRKKQRSDYRPFYVPLLYDARCEFSLDGDWLFIPEREAEGDVAAVDYDDSQAHVMDVPNLWVPFAAWLEGEKLDGRLNKGQNDKLHRLEEARCENYTFDSNGTQSAWYRHYLDFPETIGSKEVVLDFDGIALVSAIYFNGQKIQDHIGMFSPQKINVTDLVHPGRNVIAIQVWRQWKDELSSEISATVDDNYADAWNVIADAKKGESKKLDSGQRAKKLLHKHIPHGFYNNSPAGIWRDVTLVITEKVKLEDFYFRPALDGAEIDVTYANYSAQAQEVTLSYEINNKASGELLCGGVVEKKQLATNETCTTTFKTPLVSPELWGPGTPNLYNLSFRITQNDDVIDQLTDQVGFKTVEIRGDEFLLNGKPYWFRGANHMPGHMKPYDSELAKKFMELALEHNVVATRTHCSPYSKQWMDAADEAGFLISFEGPYPWLMLRDIPSTEAIEIWKHEMAELVKANRNHPSIFLWTMNNEMKFYQSGDSDQVIIEKGSILTEGIKIVRQLDPTRPVVADSAYYQKRLVRSGKYERIILDNNLDDGDMDDPHGYFNWYNESVFHFFNGEFGENYHTLGRALMGQEMSTGYPRADDALPTRAYLFLHQTPQTTVGKDAYEESDPSYFISRHSMLTKELAEMFRRVEHERSNGLMVFAFHTWFYNNHEVNKVSPMLTAQRLKLAYEPILASAELWGRHFYAGASLVSDITLVNDNEAFSALKEPKVICQLVSGGRILSSATLRYDTLEYYKTAKQTLALKIPKALGAERIDGQLILRVMVDGAQVSKNEYDVTVAQKKWAQAPDAATKGPHYIVKGDETAKRLANFYGLKVVMVSTVADLVGKKGTLIVAETEGVTDYKKIVPFVEGGGNAILLNNRKAVANLLPEWVKGYKPYRQEIVTMNRKESAVFDGLSPLDLAWFSDGREVPYAATGRFSLDRFNNQVTALAETLQWHGYLKTPLDYRKIGGVPLFKVKLGKGSVLVSELRIDAIDFDPIDARVIANILKYDFN